MGSYSGNKGNEGTVSEANGKWRRSDGLMKLIKMFTLLDVSNKVDWSLSSMGLGRGCVVSLGSCPFRPKPPASYLTVLNQPNVSL